LSPQRCVIRLTWDFYFELPLELNPEVHFGLSVPLSVYSSPFILQYEIFPGTGAFASRAVSSRDVSPLTQLV
jgi:hypothetical protein